VFPVGMTQTTGPQIHNRLFTKNLTTNFKLILQTTKTVFYKLRRENKIVKKKQHQAKPSQAKLNRIKTMIASFATVLFKTFSTCIYILYTSQVMFLFYDWA